MNGYISIEIDGQPVGLKFAYPAIKGFIEASFNKPGIYTDGTEAGNLTLEGIAKLMQQGYINNCIIKEVEPTLTYEAFYNWMEEANETEEGRAKMGEVLKIFADSYTTKRMVESVQKKSLTESPNA